MPGGCCQYVAYIRPASIARPDGVCSSRQRDLAIPAKIDDHLYIRVETVHMTRFMVHGVCRKPDAMEPDRTHVFLF